MSTIYSFGIIMYLRVYMQTSFPFSSIDILLIHFWYWNIPTLIRLKAKAPANK